MIHERASVSAATARGRRLKDGHLTGFSENLLENSAPRDQHPRNRIFGKVLSYRWSRFYEFRTSLEPKRNLPRIHRYYGRFIYNNTRSVCRVRIITRRDSFLGNTESKTRIRKTLELGQSFYSMSVCSQVQVNKNYNHASRISIKDVYL